MFAAKIKKYKSLERFLLIDYKVIIKWIPIPIRHFFFFISTNIGKYAINLHLPSRFCILSMYHHIFLRSFLQVYLQFLSGIL